MMGVILFQIYSGAREKAMEAGFLPLFIFIPEIIFPPSVILLQYLHGHKYYLQTLS